MSTGESTTPQNISESDATVIATTIKRLARVLANHSIKACSGSILGCAKTEPTQVSKLTTEIPPEGSEEATDADR